MGWLDKFLDVGKTYLKYSNPIAGSFLAGGDAASAAGHAAEAQLDAAMRAREQAMELAKASPQEMASIEQILRLQQANITKGEEALAKNRELLDAVDPALKEAGKQAYQLLQGKEAASLNILRQQRDQQRAQLQETLKNRLGSGYETSTAGAQALNAFDQQTAATLQDAQQQTMGALLGLSANVRPDLVSQTNAVYGNAANIGAIGTSALQNIATRRTNAALGSATPWIESAGAKYVKDYQAAKNMGNIFGSILGIGGQIAGTIAGGSIGGAAGGAAGKSAGGGGLSGVQTTGGAYGNGNWFA